MTNGKPVRIGLVGYKFMGKVHSHAYRTVPYFFRTGAFPVLQAIAGRDRRGLAAAAESMGWQECETDWRRLVERDDIDAVDICTPNGSHYEIALAAARAGKHILCEKPFALSVEQAQGLLDAAVAANVIHMICFNYRFAPAVQFAKRLIEERKLGQIYHFRAVYLQDWLMHETVTDSWRLDQKESGSGALGDLLAHSVDLAHFLVGEIREVTAQMASFRPNADVDDTTACLARFDCGAVGVFEASRFAKGNRNGNRIEINGSRGSLRWDLENMNHLHVYLEDDSPGCQGFRVINCTEDDHPYAGAYWPPGHILGYEHTFVNLVSEFVGGIAAGVQPRPSFEDGLRNQIVLQAIEASARQGSRVVVTV
ncbi:Gfo/Idh/MocA family protein [Paenibacillus cymbidii]|uniref:Gfo/Idh/MocA family protein n=1 Tax=Paenibacillus cymbidii TaxID=1639034 RepID=UPI00108118F5|nr:Gfo/Idh/MocA family oxidoreductase [Paenibacillus cymbidii]